MILLPTNQLLTHLAEPRTVGSSMPWPGALCGSTQPPRTSSYRTDRYRRQSPASCRSQILAVEQDCKGSTTAQNLKVSVTHVRRGLHRIGLPSVSLVPCMGPVVALMTTGRLEYIEEHMIPGVSVTCYLACEIGHAR